MNSQTLMSTATERRSPRATRRRVFLIDDHPLVREWLANVINQQPDLIVCGESEGREGCIRAMEKKRPDVAVVDISLKDCSGFDLIAEIRHQLPEVEIIVLSMHSSPQYAQRAMSAGATGYVVKRETTKRICKAIRDVLQGVPYISEEAAVQRPRPGDEPDFDLHILSEREFEIFRMLGRGNSTRQIADSLGLSIKTVQVHCGHIQAKLGIQGATDLFSYAIRWNERNGSTPL